MARRGFRAALVCVLVAAGGAGMANAYVRARTPAPHDKPLFWRALTVPYVIDAAGTADVDGEREREAVHRAFAVWHAVPCAYLGFAGAGVASGAGAAYQPGGPNRNTVSFVESGW